MTAKTKNLLTNLTKSREGDEQTGGEEQNQSTNNSSDKLNSGSGSSNVSSVSNTQEIKKSDPVPVDTGGNTSGSIRISKDDIDFITRLVRFKRMSGEVDFTKKDAINEGIQLLRNQYPNLKK